MYDPRTCGFIFEEDWIKSLVMINLINFSRWWPPHAGPVVHRGVPMSQTSHTGSCEVVCSAYQAVDSFLLGSPVFWWPWSSTNTRLPPFTNLLLSPSSFQNHHSSKNSLLWAVRRDQQLFFPIHTFQPENIQCRGIWSKIGR